METGACGGFGVAVGGTEVAVGGAVTAVAVGAAAAIVAVGVGLAAAVALAAVVGEAAVVLLALAVLVATTVLEGVPSGRVVADADGAADVVVGAAVGSAVSSPPPHEAATSEMAISPAKKSPASRVGSEGRRDFFREEIRLISTLAAARREAHASSSKAWQRDRG